MPLIEAVYFQEGPGILAKDFRDTGIPLIRLKGVEGDFVTLDGCDFLDPSKVASKWDHFRLNNGDLVISTSASFGRVSEVSWESVGAIPYTGLIRFRPKMAGLERSYLRAFLGSAAFMQQVEAMASGSVIRHFGPMHLKQMALHLPPIEEQRAIGELSNIIADRLRLLRQINATLEAIAQALFKSWFVDFDPVRAKAEGREPEGMDAATAALFPSEFEESELGVIPKGWRAGTFGEIALQSKGSVSPLNSPEVEYDHYSLPAFDTGLMSARELGEAIKSNKTPVPNGAVLISKLNPHIPRVWFTGKVRPNAVCSTEFLVWTPVDGVSAEYIFCLAASTPFNASMRQLVTGTSNSHQRVKSEYLTAIAAVVPPREITSAFGTLASPLLQRVLENRSTAQSLFQLRDTLLPRLISGKLRLPEAETLFEEATA